MFDKIIDQIIIWGNPISVILIGILIGWIIKKYFHKRLSALADKTKWRGDDIILNSLEPHIVLWFFLASVSIAVNNVVLSELFDPYKQYLATIVLIILILSITLSISKMLVGLFNLWAEKQGQGFPSTTMFTNFVYIIVWGIGLMIILDSLKIAITPILTALGVGGLAISLALKDTLSDIFSGLHILLSGKVQPGDFAELDSGERGYITNITWRNTTMLERTNNIINIPNSRLSSAIIKNYDTRESSFSVRIPIGVSYDCDLEKVASVTKEVAQNVAKNLDVCSSDEPMVRFFEFGDSSINLKVYFKAEKYGDQHNIIDVFIRSIHKRYNEEGIDIPYPIRTLIHQNSPK
ncbi:MAG: mechanosensitive ion channel family protein [Candidatus Neomarinimicrobiota bacterium]|nr:mechanosensitive ion channel family protein [Candidatus Neomarinimicrobiota bacterium]